MLSKLFSIYRIAQQHESNKPQIGVPSPPMGSLAESLGFFLQTALHGLKAVSPFLSSFIFRLVVINH